MNDFAREVEHLRRSRQPQTPVMVDRWLQLAYQTARVTIPAHVGPGVIAGRLVVKLPLSPQDKSMLTAGLLEIASAVERILGKGLYTVTVPAPDLDQAPDWLDSSISMPVMVECAS